MKKTGVDAGECFGQAVAFSVMVFMRQRMRQVSNDQLQKGGEVKISGPEIT